MGNMVSLKKDSIGMVLSRRKGLNAIDALRLVGLKPILPNNQIISGSHLFNVKDKLKPAHDIGYVTSSCYSPTLKSFIALAFLKNGSNRHGEKIKVSNPLLNKEVFATVCSPVFFDPNGERLRE